jgi:hypothetical protein
VALRGPGFPGWREAFVGACLRFRRRTYFPLRVASLASPSFQTQRRFLPMRVRNLLFSLNASLFENTAVSKGPYACLRFPQASLYSHDKIYICADYEMTPVSVTGRFF